ncbi:MAG: T9SS type A sorting domain-containing protein [Bacteroidales bacterium]|nr:T9SS type A sorting domain-containing protein [Bacteroidales bacterium]MCF8403691.1 T9SS type A sorting domain-containing protein [Bacteroidales bacterium]
MKTLLSILSLLFFLISSVNAQWPTDPGENLALSTNPGEQAIPKVATSENGVTYVSWFSNESGNYNVRLQKLDVFGNIQWDEGGILISDHPAMTWLTDWDMTVDQEDCAILTFQDIRNGDNDVFAYRISPEGLFLWGDDGIEMSTGPAFDVAPKVCVTTAGNAVFAWQADEVVILQKISPDGAKQWGGNGIVLTGSNTYSWPQLLAVGDDDVILKYFEDSGPVWAPTRHVFAQRFDNEGNMVWTEDAIVSNAGGISAWTQVFSMISDGNNGMFIAWYDDRDMNNLSSAFVQHISADGQVLLGDDGTEASTQLGRHHFYPYLALPEGSDEIFIFWNEMDGDQNNRGIYGQRINANGERLWTDNGKTFIEISAVNVYPFAASQSENELIVFYEEYSDALNASVKAMMLDKEGNFVWTNPQIALCTVFSEKVHTVASSFNSNQWIALWEDSRNGGKDIYGQNIQLDGTLGALPSQAEIEITPDTLFIEENGMVYYIYIDNVAFASYTADTVYANSDYWEFYNLPEFPITLGADDTLTLVIDIDYTGSGGSGVGYVYDTVFVHGEEEINTSLVAFNLDVIPGVKLPLNHTIKVYPNPAHEYIQITLRENLLLISAKLLNLEGQILYEGVPKNNAIQVSRFNKGVYILEVETKNQVFRRKVVVK